MNDRIDDVKDVLRKLLPAMQADGGGAEVVGLEGCVVQVRLCGTCLGCPSSGMTLKLGIERTLKEHLPWVEKVVRVA